MKYIVIEIQETDKVSTVVTIFDSKNEAESKYSEILHYAAISTIPLHSAAILTSEGNRLKSEYYEHKLEE